MADFAVAEFDNAEVRDFLKDMDSRLKKIEGGAKEFIGVLSAIVYRDVNSHFEKEQGSGGPWAKWAKSYQDSIAGKVFFRTIGNRVVQFNTANMENPPPPPRAPGKKLQDDGTLKNSFKPTNARKTSGGILWFNNAATKSGFPYAYAHDEGGPKLPKRDFMWLSDQAQENIAKQTLQFMIEKGV